MVQMVGQGADTPIRSRLLDTKRDGLGQEPESEGQPLSESSRTNLGSGARAEGRVIRWCRIAAGQGAYVRQPTRGFEGVAAVRVFRQYPEWQAAQRHHEVRS